MQMLDLLFYAVFRKFAEERDFFFFFFSIYFINWIFINRTVQFFVNNNKFLRFQYILS